MSHFPPDDASFEESDAPREDNRIELARDAVRAPAILLVVIGVLSLFFAVLSFIQRPQLAAKMNEMIQQIQQDPNMPQDEKEFWIDMFSFIKEQAEHPLSYVFDLGVGILSLLIIVGGIQMLNLSSMALPVTASILSMIPCISGCCCILGVPVGIWALVVLAKPEVKAAMARR